MPSIKEVKGSSTQLTAEQASQHVAAFLAEHTAGDAPAGVLDDAVAEQLRKVVAAVNGQAIAPTTSAESE